MLYYKIYEESTPIIFWSQFPFFSNFLMFIFERERETVSMWARLGRKTEGDTESEAGSRVWDVSIEVNVGPELANSEIMTWAEVGCLTDWATQAPLLTPVSTEISNAQKLRLLNLHKIAKETALKNSFGSPLVWVNLYFTHFELVFPPI